MGLTLLQVNGSSLVKENLAARLCHEILCGKIEPGETIIEGKWARELGVAQTSVREAINILITHGFVAKGHGRSARVVNLSTQDVVEMYHVRAALESMAARLCVERNAGTAQVDAQLAALEQEVVCGLELATVIDAALGLHLAICESSGNRYLVEHFRRLVIPVYAFTLIRATSKGLGARSWDATMPYHRRIVDALKSGDAVFAEHYVKSAIEKFSLMAVEMWAAD